MTRTMNSLSRDRYRHTMRDGENRDRSTSKGSRRKEKEKDLGPLGAGSLMVYGIPERDTSRSPRRKRLSRDREKRSSRPVSFDWDDVSKYPHEPCRAKSPDRLLESGIDCYSFIPSTQGGVLGRGKFSTVYKVTDTEGTNYALKHTPLHPHHPLIAARLLREPTLLASLPTHPCLIGVSGSIRTPGHFYLIEQYASNHVPLTLHPTPILPSRAAYLMDQLVSVVRDCLHSGGRVVHRDLKAENILVDVDTGDLLLLDLGLGTHFSMSEPKLTTCCGSPAFHSPEVVNALNHAPGEVSYYGPELDIWCIALTLLSLLLDIRFPIGSSHKSLHVMRDRVLDRLQELDEVYPPSSPWIRYCRSTELTDHEKQVEIEEWHRVRKSLRDFLDINGKRRMVSFSNYTIGRETLKRVEKHAEESDFSPGFRETLFTPGEIKYTLPLYLESESDDGSLVLANPTGLSERRVVSYIKYILRSKGVLYHCLPTRPHFLDSSTTEQGHTILQLVLPLPSHESRHESEHKKESWVSALFHSNNNLPKRSTSVPPLQRFDPPIDDKKGEWFLKTWAKIQVERPKPYSASKTSSRRGSNEITSSPTSPASPLLPLTVHSPVMSLSTLEEGVQDIIQTPRAKSVEPKSRNIPPSIGRTSSTSRIPKRPHPLSRQVSVESKSSLRIISNPTPLKVVVTLSDPKGYTALKKVLDVKQNNAIDSPNSVSSTTLITPSMKSETTVVDGEIQVRHEDQDQEHEERGRRRSKEESKVIVMTHAPRPVQVIEPTSRQPRQVSRGRRIGFLEGWFGIGAALDNEHIRSASSPPSTNPIRVFQ